MCGGGGGGGFILFLSLRLQCQRVGWGGVGSKRVCASVVVGWMDDPADGFGDYEGSGGESREASRVVSSV